MIAQAAARTQKVLKTMENGEKWTTLRLSEVMGIDHREAYMSVSNLRNAGCISAEGRRSGRSGFSTYTITTKGRDRIKRWASEDAARRMVFLPTESMVSKAVRSQPNSVFALGGM